MEAVKGLEFIWGVKSGDDFTGAEANLWTNNDIALIYNMVNDDYYVDVEVYPFQNREEEKEYLQDLLKHFAEWTRQRGDDPDAPAPLHVLFSPVDRFASPYDAYLHFKALVLGFCAEGDAK